MTELCGGKKIKRAKIMLVALLEIGTDTAFKCTPLRNLLPGMRTRTCMGFFI